MADLRHLPQIPGARTGKTGSGAPDHQAMRLWLRMCTCSTLIENELRSRMRTEFGSTLPRFDMMSHLFQEPEGIKMTELSRRMMVTNGNVTGITDHLEKQGLVKRVKVATDRRSSIIQLTDKGRATFVKMARAHEQWLSNLFEGLHEASRQSLFDSLGELKFLTASQLSGKVGPP